MLSIIHGHMPCNLKPSLNTVSKQKKLDLLCFRTDPCHLALLSYSLPLRKGLDGLLVVFWLLEENKNIEMIANIVLHLKRDTQGNHEENKKTNAGCCNNYVRVSSTLSWNISVATMSGVWPRDAAQISSKHWQRNETPIMVG